LFPFVYSSSVFLCFPSLTIHQTQTPLHILSPVDQYKLQLQFLATFNNTFPHTFSISLSVSTYSCCSRRMLQLMSESLLHPFSFCIFISFSSNSTALYQSFNRYLLQCYVPVSATYFPKFTTSYATDKFWLLPLIFCSVWSYY